MVILKHLHFQSALIFFTDLQAEILFSKYEYLLQDENQENDKMNETLAKFMRCMTILEMNSDR